MEIKELIASVDLYDVAKQFVALKPKGNEYVGSCPFHSERTASFTIRTDVQKYKCFGCGRSGDALDFLTETGMDFTAAKKYLQDLSGGQLIPTETKRTPKPRQVWQQLVPPTAPDNISHYIHGVPNDTWTYRTADGAPLGYICRFDMPDGSKDIRPYIYATNGTKAQWVFTGFNEPRPLYNLHLLHDNPEATVLVVEGEKAARAAGKLFPDYVVTTWIGGGNGIKKADFAPLYGRHVILWPDNDHTHKYGTATANAGQLMPIKEQPGMKAMLEVGRILQPYCENIQIINIDTNIECGWDLADEPFWDNEEATEYLNSHISTYGAIPPPTPLPPTAKLQYEETDFFRFLGYIRDGSDFKVCLYDKKTQTIFTMSGSSIGKGKLMELAPLEWWMAKYNGKMNTENCDNAQNWLIQKSKDVGPFNQKSIRGRGAWIDRSDIVINIGDELIVNGSPVGLHEYPSKYIYNRDDRIDFRTDRPLVKQEAFRLLEVMSMLNWEKSMMAYQLAGWCVLAPFCGVLHWRPHVWLTGSAGTGKSWTFTHIVRRMLGDMSLSVSGATTEAAIRQLLDQDAIPVVFDEAEPNTKAGMNRIEATLELMRGASTSDGGQIAKGTSSGVAKMYSIQSCFAFASINVPLSRKSDKSRISILTLERINDKAIRERKWEELQAYYAKHITPDFAYRLQARTMKMLHIILANTVTFSNATAEVLGSQRSGDQYGVLLAAAYSLTSDHEISHEDAVKWVESKDWADEMALAAQKDEMNLFGHIMEQLVDVATGTHGRQERTVSELVLTAANLRTDHIIRDEDAAVTLARIGIRVEGDEILISNGRGKSWINNIMDGTDWAKGHADSLKRIIGAKVHPGKSFGGITTRSVGVPLKVLTGELAAEEEELRF